MSLSPLDPSTVRAAAQAALDARLGLIDAIVAAQNERTAAATKVAEANAVERAAAAKEQAAIKGALDGGWSAAELRASGLKVPHSAATKKTASTPAATKSSNARTPRVRPTVTTSGSATTTETTPDTVQSPDTDRTGSGQSVPDENYANAS